MYHDKHMSPRIGAAGTLRGLEKIGVSVYVCFGTLQFCARAYQGGNQNFEASVRKQINMRKQGGSQVSCGQLKRLNTLQTRSKVLWSSVSK